MNTPSRELFESRKAEMKRFIASRNGIRAYEIEDVIHLGRSRANVMLLNVVRLGEIYKSGSGSSTRFWINEAHFLRNQDIEVKPASPAKPKPVKPVVISDREIKKRESSPMKFLCRKRPAGINTIFDECRQNSTVILPVLQVMAARRVA